MNTMELKSIVLFPIPEKLHAVLLDQDDSSTVSPSAPMVAIDVSAGCSLFPMQATEAALQAGLIPCDYHGL
ncbi:hypothetical protein NAV33_21070 [Pseudomonas stutzeri]|uniref:hypothetical protein n=1 Tax=Stutzerimonas stutzeri TaxID=316 RepID=UPI00210EB1A4|nr:hypothetical protein [Stutzerimonas stutzeri]MCQ4314366.1 hypothetical protein [Stutzerimonas stutzeri]